MAHRERDSAINQPARFQWYICANRDCAIALYVLETYSVPMEYILIHLFVNKIVFFLFLMYYFL